MSKKIKKESNDEEITSSEADTVKLDESPDISPNLKVSSKLAGIEDLYINSRNTILNSRPANILKRCGIPDMLLLRFLAVFFFFSGLNTYQMRAKGVYAETQMEEFVQGVNIGKTIFFMFISFILLTALHWFMPKKYRMTDQILAFGAIFFFDMALLWRNTNIYLGISFAVISAVFVNYIIDTLKEKQLDMLNKFPTKISFCIVMAVAIVIGALLSITMILRDKCFESHAFDLGIFIQMFDHMADDLRAITTCERDFELSHFKVHSSYIYYLLLPFYKMFRSQITLHIAHSVFVIGGVIPLFLIAKKRNITGLPLGFIGLAYCFNTGLIGPSYFFFHENSFLPTLLMWLLWAIDNRKYLMLYIISALVCIVKEDAPLFVICIGLYMFFEQKGELKRIHGIIVALLSGIYMIKILDWLTLNGCGQSMSLSRFGHILIDPNGGIAEVVKNAFTDPSYIFSMLFMERTSSYLLAIMVPLLFTPFLTKKIYRYLLMMPFIVTNLIIGALYSCAADIGFQYTLGPTTLLIYMSVVNISEMEKSHRQRLSVLIAVVSIVLTYGTQSKFLYSITTYKENKSIITEIDEMLDSIPKDASVLCDPYYVTHAAHRREIYVFDLADVDTSNNTLIQSERYDFIAVPVNSDLNKTIRSFFDENGYKVYDEVPDRLIVYQAPFYKTKENE
ncbi:MAG: DUF2079 domain-containing protein [Ruminococcus sp.]|nr:DUF2079 domain-containing protein [Ruminococcus sp.]